MRFLFLCPAAFMASAAHADLSPVEGRVYRYDSIETRTGGGSTLRFATHRTVLFRRDAQGLVAEVRLDSMERPDNKAIGAMFAAGQAGLLHRPIRFHIDVAGTVTAIDDIASVWTALLGGMEKMGDVGSSASGDPRATAQAMTAPLRALPAERRLAMLGSIVAPLLNAGAAMRATGERPVTLPARPPAAPEATLSGTEIVSRAADGDTTIRITASGPIAPASRIPTDPSQAGSTGTMAMTSIKNIASTGMLIDSHEARETTLRSPQGEHHTLIETITTLQLTN